MKVCKSLARASRLSIVGRHSPCTHALKEKFDGSIAPLDHMLRVLNRERYSMIHA